MGDQSILSWIFLMKALIEDNYLERIEKNNSDFEFQNLMLTENFLEFK